MRALESFDLAYQHSPGLLHLGEACLVADRLVEARALAGRVLPLTRERGFEAWALRLLGETASHRDSPALGEAADSYRDALALADALGMRPLMAHCHLGLGKLSRRTGDTVKAQDHLTTAITMYQEMDMAFWLAKAEAEVGALG